MAFTETTNAWVSPAPGIAAEVFPLEQAPWTFAAYSIISSPPPNPAGIIDRTYLYAVGGWRIWAASQHPGGVNAGFADGSVHFIKNSINSWPCLSTGNPPASYYTETYTPNVGYIYSLTAAAQVGVWQALSTKANGEVISSDSY